MSYEAVRVSLSEAARWRLLSLLLERPKSGWHRHVEALAVESGDTALCEAAVLAQAASEENYLAVLGPGGIVSPREVAYSGFEDPGRVLADIHAYYEAFVFSPNVEDPLDHVVVETAFLAYLCLKEAFAVASENWDGVQVTRESRDQFLRLHAGRLIRGVAAKLKGDTPGYLRKTAQVLLEQIQHLPETAFAEQPAPDPLAAGCPMDCALDPT